MHKDLYSSFSNGDFVVKTKSGTFNAVSPDMKLEQTIQRSAKSSKGIIGQSKKIDCFTEWGLVYHEILEITNAFYDMTNANKFGNTENRIHHELYGSTAFRENKHIENLVDLINSHCNPWLLEGQTKLQNFVTQIYVESEVAEAHLNFLSDTELLFNEYYKKVYVDKTALIHDKITRFNLLPLDHTKKIKDMSKKEVKMDGKIYKQANQILMIGLAKNRGECKVVLQYDITKFSYLFEGNQMTKPNKAELIKEVEKKVNIDSQSPIVQNSSVFIDFMSFIRGQRLEKLPVILVSLDILKDYPDHAETISNKNEQWTFGKMVEELFCRILKKYENAISYHIIFDSYIEGSLKGGERTHRLSKSKGVIHLAKINVSTKVPEQMDKFWSSDTNKEKLQIFAKNKILELAKLLNINVVMSGVIIDNENLLPGIFYNREEGKNIPIPELKFSYEEADMRIIPHIKWEIESYPERKRVLVISQDTDIVILLLFYMKSFKSLGLTELYMQLGKGDGKRWIPIHLYQSELGHDYCKALLKFHLGTGCDYLSKIGTKSSALKAKPEANLNTFGESVNLDDAQIQEAEKYLVNVMSSFRLKSNISSFDELREKYIKKGSVLDLPPTSYSIIYGHIPRWWFLYKIFSNLLSHDFGHLKPQECGWNLIDGELQPNKCLNLVPDKLCKTCTCKSGCSSRRCSCKEDGYDCTEYCICINCKNRQVV